MIFLPRSVIFEWRKIFFIAVLLLVVSFTSCLKEKAFEIVEVSNTDTTSACSDTVFFASEIMGELLTPSCNTAGCHNSSAAAGYEFTSYSSVSANVLSVTINSTSFCTAGGL